MRFGLGQFTLQVPPWDSRAHADLYADTLELIELAERADFDSVWLAEHHGASDGYVPSLLPFLAAAAARTSKIKLGTAVMLAPFHHPLRLAEDAAVVDNISGGRLRLGLGLGWVPEEYRMFGVEQRGRGRRLEEIVDVLRLAWSPGRFSYEGRHLSFTDVAVSPKPAGRIPIWLGGATDPALRRASRIADGHFPPSTAGVSAIGARAEQVLQMRRDAGVEGPFGYGVFLPVGIGRDADDAWASIREGVLHTRGAYMLWGGGERDVSGARDAAAPYEDQVRASCVVGTPAEVASQLRPIAEKLDGLGLAEAFTSVILAPPGMTRARAAEAIERFATEVVPRLG